MECSPVECWRWGAHLESKRTKRGPAAGGASSHLTSGQPVSGENQSEGGVGSSGSNSVPAALRAAVLPTPPFERPAGGF